VTAFVSGQGGGGGTPMGTVTFLEGTTVLAADVPLDSGHASISLANFNVGNNLITAVFEGENGWLSSSGQVLHYRAPGRLTGGVRPRLPRDILPVR
jgi:hypothetical protein